MANQSSVGYMDDMEEATLQNTNFRQVVFTGKHSQLVLMCLKPGEEIGEEVHGNVDQFFRIEQGTGEVYMNEEKITFKDDDAFIVPAGVKHNVKNIGDNDLKLYTIYSPPNHPDGTIHRDKAEADAYEEEHHHE